MFLEHDVDNAPPTRYGRFWAAYAGGSASLPLVMVDSGNRTSTGYLDFYNVYKGMVDAELARPAQADVRAYYSRMGNKVHFLICVTNLSGDSLGAANSASVHAMVYEDAKVHSTSRYVRAAVAQDIASLASGATASFDLETPDLVGVDWDRLHYVAAVDYRPGSGGGAYDMLQAAVALPIGASLSVRPDALTFEVGADDVSAPAAAVTVDALSPMQWSASSSAAWLRVVPENGTTPTQSVVSVLNDGLELGFQQGTVTFASADGLYSDQLTVNVYYGGSVKTYLPLIVQP